MPVARSVITVDPQGRSMVVDVQNPAGVSVACYTDVTGGTARSMPLTISSATDFYLTRGGDYLVSALLGGREVAGGNGAKASATLANDGATSVTVRVDERELLDVANATRSLELAYAQSTATFTHTDGATPAAITGLVINVEAQTEAYYVRVWAGAVDSTVSGDILLVDIFDGTSVVSKAAVTVYAADGNVPLIAEARIPAGSGAKTYTARCSRLLGAGTPHVYGGSDFPAFVVARRA